MDAKWLPCPCQLYLLIAEELFVEGGANGKATTAALVVADGSVGTDGDDAGGNGDDHLFSEAASPTLNWLALVAIVL